MASRVVMNESAKWRSGRDRDRTVSTGPDGRGGKSADALGDDEIVAAHDDRDVMVPARVGATLEVIEAELTFEVLVHAFRAPAFLEDPYDLLLAHDARQGREHELAGLTLSLGPLGHEPKRLAVGESDAVVVRRLDANKGEARLQLAARPVAPGESAECLARECSDQLLHKLALGVDSVESVEANDAQSGQHAHGEVEPHLAKTVAKIRAIPVCAVGQENATRDSVAYGALDHLERELDLGLERDLVGDSRLGAANGVVGPHLGQVELEVHGDLLGARRDRQAHADLAVGDLAGRAGVLALNADRVRALLEKPRVVDDPRGHWLSLLHRLDGVACGLQPHGSVVPMAARQEVQQLLVDIVSLLRRATSAGRDRLGALALAVAEHPERVHGERLALAPILQVRADPSEELLEPRGGGDLRI